MNEWGELFVTMLANTSTWSPSLVSSTPSYIDIATCSDEDILMLCLTKGKE